MKNIKLEITSHHIPFVADAIEAYANDLVEYITNEAFMQITEESPPESFGPGLTEALRQAIDKGEFEKPQKKRTNKSPYGYKTDGTPKQKPGRKV
jgi:hypothetical protein